MRTRQFGIVASLLLLAACASPPPAHEAVPPPSGAELRAVPQESVAVEPAAGTSADEPLSTEYVPVQATSNETLVIAVPESSGWDNPEMGLTRRQSDIEACYGYAAAQVARDDQIDSDRHQIRDDDDDVLGLTTLTRRVDFYSQPRRRDSLFDSCMRAKGYVER
jgi:hypothetical protein